MSRQGHIRTTWMPAAPTAPPSPCKASCCWTPLGHSTVRDAFPSWHRYACHCHDPKDTK